MADLGPFFIWRRRRVRERSRSQNASVRLRRQDAVADSVAGLAPARCGPRWPAQFPLPSAQEGPSWARFYLAEAVGARTIAFAKRERSTAEAGRKMLLHFRHFSHPWRSDAVADSGAQRSWPRASARCGPRWPAQFPPTTRSAPCGPFFVRAEPTPCEHVRQQLPCSLPLYFFASVFTKWRCLRGGTRGLALEGSCSRRS